MVCKTVKLSTDENKRIELAVRMYNKNNNTDFTTHGFMKYAILAAVNKLVKQTHIKSV